MLILLPRFHCHLSDLREVGRSGSPPPGSDPVLSRGWTLHAHAKQVLAWPRTTSRFGWWAPSGRRRLQVRGVSSPAVCSVPLRPGVYSALDFRTAGLRALTRYVHAAAPRLPLGVAVGVAAPPLLQFEVSCC
ncbi:hypothetical protein NDU88_001805 [Pleurodeles waltl]|uniref:Uncharacterized protein n=1 Tax=Pleurodeles waltl TaxID=8319 RepID=A0AAV7WQG7_PLEWA|nr:hypothetical protein NDU88_001805 [Pleurodeles waltl]